MMVSAMSDLPLVPASSGPGPGSGDAHPRSATLAQQSDYTRAMQMGQQASAALLGKNEESIWNLSILRAERRIDVLSVRPYQPRCNGVRLSHAAQGPAPHTLPFSEAWIA
jgi:hypothetical protein